MRRERPVRRPTTHSLVALALALAPSAPLAWGKGGHEVVAALAERRLGPAARSLVRELIGTVPISDPEIATWADAVRDARTGPWHYVNIPFSAESYEPGRDCPRGACAVAAIQRFSEVLAGGADLPERQEALRWIVHLVADLHQPLHAGDGWDRGGNDFPVRLGRRKQPTNFHRLWDADVVGAVLRHRDPPSVARELDSRISSRDAALWASDLDPASWAMESSREARALYQELGRRPADRTILRLPADYPERERRRALVAIEKAGVRLAALLDDVASRRRADSGR